MVLPHRKVFFFFQHFTISLYLLYANKLSVFLSFIFFLFFSITLLKFFFANILFEADRFIQTTLHSVPQTRESFDISNIKYNGWENSPSVIPGPKNIRQVYSLLPIQLHTAIGGVPRQKYHHWSKKLNSHPSKERKTKIPVKEKIRENPQMICQ